MHEIEYSNTPYWIQIHGMPLEFFLKQNAIRVGSKIGEVIEAKDPFDGTTINMGFLRVRVSVNIKKPTGCRFLAPKEFLPKNMDPNTL